MWIRLTTSLLIACCAWSSAGEPHRTQPPDIPAPITELKANIQGKNPDEVLAIIQARFGGETRNIGSGLSIPQWDVAGGVLTFHPFRGPSFSHGTITVMLIDTQNKVGRNIPGNYQMSTLLDNYRTRFSIGELVLQTDGSYRFKRVGPWLAYYTKDASNFFTAHPSGTYTVFYPKPVQESSVMESLPDKSVIATLKFVADPADKPAGETQAIDLLIDVPERTLYFAPHIEPPLTYQVEKSWEEFWN